MNLSELLPRLSGVRRGWAGYSAKCPAHDDQKQSLSLGEGDGRVLLKCFAGCDTRDVMKQLGLGLRDLYDPHITKPSHESLGKADFETQEHNGVVYFASPNTPKVHTIYPYVDKDGNLLYENVRYYPKEFRQRRFDEKGKPIWNLN